MLPLLPRLIHDVAELVFRRPVLGAAVVAIDPEGRVVLARRRDTGTWGVPGGVMRLGEQVAETAARELREETGYTVREVTRLVGVYSSPQRDPRAHSVLVLLEARVEPPIAPIALDPLEVSEVRAFAPEELPTQLAHDGARLLADWRRGAVGVID